MSAVRPGHWQCDGFLLFTEEENLGALNLHSSSANAFGQPTEHIGGLLPARGDRHPSGHRRSDRHRHGAVRERTG